MFLCVISLAGCKKKKSEKERMCTRIDIEAVLSLFPQSVGAIHALGSGCKELMQSMIQSIDAIPAEQRTFANSIRPYDAARLQCMVNKNLLTIFALLSSNPELQAVANAQVLDVDQFETDVLSRNVSIYQSFKEYNQHGQDLIRKTGANTQYVQKIIQQYEHAGMLLPAEQRADLVNLEKEANMLAAQFNGNIVYDARSLIKPLADLQGVPESFLQTLRQDDQDNYVLPIDFTTFFMIMENCQIEKTRKDYFVAFGQRAYPQNQSVLHELLNKRQAFAQTIGVQDYATYELSDQMIKDPKRAEHFLWNMVHALQKYDTQDFAELTKDLPPSVELTKHGMLQPWDEAFVKSWYRKHHFHVSDYDIAAYFPLDHTLEQLLQLFAQFFYIEFRKEEINPAQLWAPDVLCYRVYSLRTQSVMGYLFLDLYDHSYKKVQEPCHFMLIPTIKDDCSIRCAGASVMVANFALPIADKPTLLELSDVISVFHELGHALHALFGATCYADFSGTQVVKDFVEVPSQMLEHWLEQPSVLQKISNHYKTGLPLTKEMIEQILAAERFGKAGRMLKQAFLGLVSLEIYRDGYKKDIHHMIKKLYKQVFKHIVYEPEHYFEYSFAHLANYGASYYTYVWSRVIAADLFDTIKQRGMFDNQVGQEYVRAILSPGGFRSPHQTVKKFLKRPFNTKAFVGQFETTELM